MKATVSLSEARTRAWEAIVIGAGPAGSVAARQLARAGLRALLVDRVALPRTKVCGCCLAPRGVRRLESLGLESALEGATALQRLRVISGGREASLAAPGYRAIGRDVFDVRLASLAGEAGAELLWPASARISPDGRVRITQGEEEIALCAAVVVVADGLGGLSLSERTDAAWTIAPRSRMGAGATLAEAPLAMEDREVVMLCERAGYLGIVRLPDGRYDAAAAFDPRAVRNAGGPARLAAEFVRRAGGVGDAASAARWKATGLLTRRRSAVERDGVLLVGDAAGYVEPFTGEGMTWAIESADEAAAHVAAMLRGAGGESWTRAHSRLLGARRWRCGLVAAGLRRPMFVRLAQMAMSTFPQAASALAARFCAPGSAPMAAGA